MDHCPVPSNPTRPPIRIPCFVPEEYVHPLGDLDFCSYPEDQGWWTTAINHHGLENRLESLRLTGQPGDVFANPGLNQFLQEWSVFGLLSEVLQQPIPARSLISTSDDGHKYVSTAKLPDLIREWILEVRAQPTEASQQENHAWDCIQTVISCLGKMGHFNAKSPEVLDVNDDLVVSCGILVSDLTRAVHLAYEIVSEDLEIHSWKSGYFLMQSRNPRAPEMLTPLPGDEVLKARMVADGWCPSDVYRISSQASIPSTLYFVSMFDKPRPLLRHENCTSMYCKHWKVDEGSYVTNHVSDGCDCQSVATPLGDIEEILSSGSDLIPLITPDITNVGADGQKYVKLERSSPERRYVAISHVWSDGRGNPTANEIPLCQFRRLSAIVKQAWGDSQVFFWFDTLCFPYPASADKPAYKQAMERMRTTYEKADLVLVLDSYLLAKDHAAMTEQEIPLRILCSGWNIEYRLAKRTMFQFKSGTVEMPFALLDKPVWTTDYIFENIKSMRIVRPKSLVPFLEKPARMNITTLQKELCFRATSVAEDEALCLANLLGLDSEQIVNARPADRMKIIWQNVDPHSAFEALFWPCQRMDQDGLRWAPKSLMFRCLGAVSVLPAGHTEGSVEDGKFVPRGPSRLVKVSPRGISFQCGGVMLSGFSQRPPGPTFKFEEGKRCYSVHAVYDDQGRVVPSDAGSTTDYTKFNCGA